MFTFVRKFNIGMLFRVFVFGYILGQKFNLCWTFITPDFVPGLSRLLLK
jgi:hypothetical protein